MPWRMARFCLAVGPWPVSKRRKGEWHHHLVAAVDTGLTIAFTRCLIRSIPPAFLPEYCPAPHSMIRRSR